MTSEQALTELFNKRAWYKKYGLKESTARAYKKRFLDRTLEIETQMKILSICGFKMVQEMQWEQENTSKRKKLCISPRAFWDTDFSKLNTQTQKEFIIRRVFERGRWDDVLNTISFYGDKTVINALLEAEYLPEGALYLAAAIFKLNIEQFKCYTNKQYRPSSKKR
jgi:hypothetical protein